MSVEFETAPGGDDAGVPWRGAVVAIGNFDGIHRGHQAVLLAARQEADRLGCAAVLLTFEPHPRAFFSGRSFFRLTPAPLKASVAKAFGMDGVLTLPFDAGLAGLTAQEFVDRVLVSRLAIPHAVTGFDFHFGHKRGGTPAYLAEAGRAKGFGVTVVPPIGDSAGAISSTRIREALASGEVRDAEALLGWHWSVSAQVIPGERRGRELGYPTANMALDPEITLRHGIYAVRYGRADGATHDGVASFGRRPTFDNGPPLLETFLFDFSGTLYGQPGLVSFVSFIRPEAKFDTVEALVAQMEQDSIQARASLARSPARETDRRLLRAWAATIVEKPRPSYSWSRRALRGNSSQYRMSRWLTNSRDLVSRLKDDGWELDRIRGSHHHFRKAGVQFIITVPHPKKDLPRGLVKSIYDKAGWPHPGV